MFLGFSPKKCITMVRECALSPVTGQPATHTHAISHGVADFGPCTQKNQETLSKLKIKGGLFTLAGSKESLSRV